MRDRVTELRNRLAQVQSCVGGIKHTFGLASDVLDDTNDPSTKPALAGETRTKETV
jgi:hypothetical protein